MSLKLLRKTLGNWKVSRYVGFLLLGLYSSLAPAAPPDQSQTELAPRSSSLIQSRTLTYEPPLSHAAKLALIRQKIRYVFVLFQENRSFDFYFASYPGADGLYNHPPSDIAGFTQTIVNTDGSLGTISPFKIPFSITNTRGVAIPLYPSDIASVNHSHVAIARKLDVGTDNTARNDQYALTEEGVRLVNGKPDHIPSLERKQFGELVMAHIDCDAAPFLWRYADRFTLFDHFMDTVIGPSTPNAIAMISGQTGETQWLLHPELANGSNGTAGLPILSDPMPYWGSMLDPTDPKVKQPEPSLSHNRMRTPAPNLTFATLPLSFMGKDVRNITSSDRNAALDLLDVQNDIEKIAGHAAPPTDWGWYQQGYDHEPSDGSEVASHTTYVVHHNAPQYFGYIANNPKISDHMHGLGDFFADVAARRLPSSAVFYVRGGFGNIFGEHPLDLNPKLATVINGDDDHPGYSDSQLSESLLAREINAIARSPYWPDSVIFIAYDESDGLYDHIQPRVRTHDAAGLPLDQGPRIPFLLISPYAATHTVSHEPAEHSSIIKFVDNLFHLVPLADLPDEERARAIGAQKYHQKDFGPADDKVDGVGDLLSGFSNARLLGRAAPLPASFAEIPETEIKSYPHYKGRGCSVLQIHPTDEDRPNPVPDDFNPRPDLTPGIPASGNWIP